jgi:hypothetical protein
MKFYRYKSIPMIFHFFMLFIDLCKSQKNAEESHFSVQLSINDSKQISQDDVNIENTDFVSIEHSDGEICNVLQLPNKRFAQNKQELNTGKISCKDFADKQTQITQKTEDKAIQCQLFSKLTKSCLDSIKEYCDKEIQTTPVENTKLYPLVLEKTTIFINSDGFEIPKNVSYIKRHKKNINRFKS